MLSGKQRHYYGRQHRLPPGWCELNCKAPPTVQSGGGEGVWRGPHGHDGFPCRELTWPRRGKRRRTQPTWPAAVAVEEEEPNRPHVFNCPFGCFYHLYCMATYVTCFGMKLHMTIYRPARGQ